jgi:hypothetical protein
MPSLLITLLSIFKIAVLIVRAGGKTVKPILIAFERFVSSTVTSLLASPPFYIKKEKKHRLFFIKNHKTISKIFSQKKKTRSRYTKSTLTEGTTYL